MRLGHLGDAATTYGVQGATVDTSHTILTEATSAAGIYVGMTRGREHNRLHLIAEDMADAKAQFVAAMERDPADRGLTHATAQAADAVRGIVKNGPIQRVTEELARLNQEADHAQRQAERWARIAARLDTQRATHRAEDDESTAALRKAEDEAARVRTEVAQPLAIQAAHDGTAYLATVRTEAATSARLATTGRFGRRQARAEHHAATEQSSAARASSRAAWGELPRTPESLSAWAARAAERRAESHPRVTDADRAVETAHSERRATRQRHKRERVALLVSELGADQARSAEFGMSTINPYRTVRDARTRAAMLRAEADELRALPVNDAARLIEARRADQEKQRQQVAECERQISDSFEHDRHRADPYRDGPSPGL